MSFIPARSPLDLGGLQLNLKSGQNIVVVHGLPFTEFQFPAGVDSEIVFTEVPPTRGTQVQLESFQRLVRVKHRILSGGAGGDASVSLTAALVDKAGNTTTNVSGILVTPSTQGGFAFDVEHVFDVSAFSGDLTDATFFIGIIRSGSTDTLTDPLRLLHSWMEVVTP